MSEEMDSENKDNKSAAPDLPQGYSRGIAERPWICFRDSDSEGMTDDEAWAEALGPLGITREEWAHAQECVRLAGELGVSEFTSGRRERAELRARAERAEACEHFNRQRKNEHAATVDDLRAELATTREALAEARHSAVTYRDAWEELLDDDDPSDRNWLAWESPCTD